MGYRNRLQKKKGWQTGQRQHGDKIEYPKSTRDDFADDQCDVDSGGKIVGAFSTSHSMVSALPAMSANSAPGTRERISVAAVLGVCV